jgi:hypothetical protein
LNEPWNRTVQKWKVMDELIEQAELSFQSSACLFVCDLLAAEEVLEGLIERGVFIVRIIVRRMAS